MIFTGIPALTWANNHFIFSGKRRIKEEILYVEVHRNGFTLAELEKEALRITEEKAYDWIDDDILRNAIKEASGIPVSISKMHEKWSACVIGYE